MRFSQGASYGRCGELYHPEMFSDREEVIVFKREEFTSSFRSMMDQIEFIEDINLKFEQKKDYELMGLWPQIMGRVHIIDVSIDGFFIRKPIQSRLDAFLYPVKESVSTELIESSIKLPEKPLGVDWYK
jgi:hypothetical protein